MTEPWRFPGQIVYIPGDDASVPPLPPGTVTGNHRELARQFEPFTAAMVDLTAHPEAMRNGINHLMQGWDPTEFDERCRHFADPETSVSIPDKPQP